MEYAPSWNPSSTETDQFRIWSTDVLISIAFRVTPSHEQQNWAVTSEFAADYQDRPEKRRELVVEQLECLGVTIHDVNRMKS